MKMDIDFTDISTYKITSVDIAPKDIVHKEDIIYKAILKAEDYLNGNIEIKPMQSGDTIFISDTNPVTVGDKYKNYPAKVYEIFYMPKSWWQFWKRKQQLGYMKNILRKINSRQGTLITFEDGVSLRWIPATTSSRGYKFGKMWCDRTISDEMHWYIKYSMFFGSENDIVWL